MWLPWWANFQSLPEYHSATITGGYNCWYDCQFFSASFSIFQMTLVCSSSELDFGNTTCHVVLELVHWFYMWLWLLQLQVEAPAGVSTSVYHEQGLLHQGVHVAVVCKLAHGEKFVPIVWMLVHEEMEELLHFLGDMFGLTVHLWVVICMGMGNL